MPPRPRNARTDVQFGVTVSLFGRGGRIMDGYRFFPFIHPYKMTCRSEIPVSPLPDHALRPRRANSVNHHDGRKMRHCNDGHGLVGLVSGACFADSAIRSQASTRTPARSPSLQRVKFRFRRASMRGASNVKPAVLDVTDRSCQAGRRGTMRYSSRLASRQRRGDGHDDLAMSIPPSARSAAALVEVQRCRHQAEQACRHPATKSADDS